MTPPSLAAPPVDPPTRPDALQLRGISRRYTGRWLQGYVHGKLRSDPVYAAAAAEIGAFPAPVLDVGCGIGLLAHYLYATGCRVPYLGVDVDAHKIDSARRALRDVPLVRFETGSCETLAPWQGHVLLLDILHYLDERLQRELLHAAAERVSPGATLIVRTALRDHSWRFAATRIEEFFIHRSHWIRLGTRDYPRLDDLHSALAGTGLHWEVAPLFGRTPFNSYLLVARRRAAATA